MVGAKSTNKLWLTHLPTLACMRVCLQGARSTRAVGKGGRPQDRKCVRVFLSLVDPVGASDLVKHTYPSVCLLYNTFGMSACLVADDDLFVPLLARLILTGNVRENIWKVGRGKAICVILLCVCDCVVQCVCC